MIKSKLRNCYLRPKEAQAGIGYYNGKNVENAADEVPFYALANAKVFDEHGDLAFEGDLIIANLDGYKIEPR